MASVSAREIVKSFEKDSNLDGWTDKEKELLITALFSVYKNSSPDVSTMAIRVQELEALVDDVTSELEAVKVRLRRANVPVHEKKSIRQWLADVLQLLVSERDNAIAEKKRVIALLEEKQTKKKKE